MQSRTKWFASLVAAVALAIGIGSVTAPVGAEELPVIFAQCGDVITSSAKLGNNITGCQQQFGLFIQGEGVTLDLGGRTVSGADKEDTIGIWAANGSKIRNGIVRDWDRGVQFQEVTGGSARDILATSNTLAGIVVCCDATGITLRDNRLIGNQGHGLSISNAKDITLINNKLKTNDQSGLHVDGLSDSRIEGNTFAANQSYGAYLEWATQNIFVANTFEGNWKGLHLNEGSSGNTIESNDFLANFMGVEFISADSNLFRLNSVKKSTGYGLFVNSSSEDTVLSKNTVNGNAADGMRIDDPTTLVKSNIANNNGFDQDADDDFGLGIRALFGAQGSGNTATGNDDPAQCSPQALCS